MLGGWILDGLEQDRQDIAPYERDLKGLEAKVEGMILLGLRGWYSLGWGRNGLGHYAAT